MDVIGIDGDRPDAAAPVGPRRAGRSGVLLAAATTVAAALVGVLIGRVQSVGASSDDAAVGDLTGRMVLELQKTQPDPQRQALSGQAEYRGEDWQGTITIEASDLTGGARLNGSGSYVFTASGNLSGPVVSHMWGSAEVTLDAQSCTGTYAYTSYRRDPDEGSGSLHLRCDGGSVFGATMTAAGTDPPSGARDWTITVALTDGYLVER